MADLYLNGKYLGTVEDAKAFVGEIKDLRRNGSFFRHSLNIIF